MNVYKPLTQLKHLDPRRFSVFLAGSIEMGAAPDWQKDLEQKLKGLNLDIYNPRRDNWDPNWTQSADNPIFREQVEWELFGLEQASLIIMYLAPGTISPISLLEVGLYLTTTPNKLIVCCPKGFHRKGNVDIVCERYAIPQATDLGELETIIRTRHRQWFRQGNHLIAGLTTEPGDNESH
jgi:hypothetical protein